MTDDTKSDLTTVPPVAKKNIEEITKIENEYLRQRTVAERISDATTAIVGSMSFALAQVVFCAVWIATNAGVIPGIAPFDRYPFGFLSFVLGLEAIVLSTFILMSQNRQVRRADHWEHLDLQVSLLSEKENTKILRMLEAMCVKMGIAQQVRDGELEQMISNKSVGDLAERLAEKLEKTRDQSPPPA